MYNQTKPFFHLGKIPIHGVELVLLMEILGVVAVVVTQKALISALYFDPSLFLSGQIWRIVTYPLASVLDLGFILGVVFFYHFGRILENALGLKLFLNLCGVTILLAPLILTLFSVCGLSINQPLMGNELMHLSFFAAFCVMYPETPSFFGIKIKWLGLIFVSLSILMPLQSGSYHSSLAHLATIAFAILVLQGRGLARIRLFPESFLTLFRDNSSPKLIPFPSKRKRSRKIKFTKQTPLDSTPPPLPKREEKRGDTPPLEVDDILDKINEQGLNSLTVAERTKLEEVGNNKQTM